MEQAKAQPTRESFLNTHQKYYLVNLVILEFIILLEAENFTLFPRKKHRIFFLDKILILIYFFNKKHRAE